MSMPKYHRRTRVADPGFIGVFVRTSDAARSRGFAVRYTSVSEAEARLPIKKVLSRALLSQLHPGQSTEALAKAKARKDLRRGPEYQIVTDPERERGLRVNPREHLSAFASSHRT